jgi:hypothetical protein
MMRAGRWDIDPPARKDDDGEPVAGVPGVQLTISPARERPVIAAQLIISPARDDGEAPGDGE